MFDHDAPSGTTNAETERVPAPEVLEPAPVPPPPPAPPAPPPPPPTVDAVDQGLLKMNACGFSLAACFKINGLSGLINGSVMKLTRNHQAGITDEPVVASLKPFRVASPEIPAEGKPELAKLANALLEAGYQAPQWYQVIDGYNGARFYRAVMRHESGTSFAVLTYRAWHYVQPIKHSHNLRLVTALSNGEFAVSEAGKPVHSAPAGLIRHFVSKDANLATLIKEHAEQLQRLQRAPTPLPDDAAAAEAMEACHERYVSNYLARGIFQPLSDAERDLVKRSRIDGEYADQSDILLEINRRNDSQLAGTSKLKKLGILAVSLAVFLLVQRKDASWNFIATLVGVLLFHESGHFLAMKLFGYRDVRMFFIPFFGAAVTGRKISVASWKQALVSLAGPVPGIVVGTVLGSIGLISNKPWCIDVASMLLILNVINLLPVLPLDGGQFVEAVLFSRSPKLSVVFRGLAVVALVGIYVLTKNGVFLSLAVAFGIALPLTYRVAVVAEDLRREGAVPLSTEQTIPPHAAGLISARLRSVLKTGQNRKTLAIFATQVYERVSMPPTSLLGSAGLLAIYLGSGALGAVFGAVLLVASQGNLRNFARMAKNQPEHTIGSSGLQAWDGSQSCARLPHATLVATFPKSADAQQNFDAWKAQLPPAGALRLFGDSVFVMLPAKDAALRKEWMGRLDGASKEVFALNPGQGCGMRFQFVAGLTADKIKELEEQLDTYFSVTAFHAIAPWDADDTRSESVRAEQQRARRTYYQLTHVDYEALQAQLKDNAQTEQSKNFMEAMRRGDRAEIKRLAREQREAYQRKRDAQFAAVRAQPDVRTDVVDLVAQHESDGRKLELAGPVEDNEDTADSSDAANGSATERDGPGRLDAEKKARDDYDKYERDFNVRMAALVGATSTDFDPKARTVYSVAGRGSIHHEGMYFEIPFCQFEDPANGAPGLTGWLQQRGASVKYALIHFSAPERK